MGRSTTEVFEHHKNAILKADFPEILADYANDAVLLTMDGAFVGVEAIQGFFVNLFSSQPNVRVNFKKHVVEGEVLLLEWSAESDIAVIPKGVDTFIIRDDKIQHQTMWFTMVPKDT